ncbi:CAP domain-containing protein [Roseimaritima ulvae]|nr:CAP domain-containing protein [Roseimaritima ulvae]
MSRHLLYRLLMYLFIVGTFGILVSHAGALPAQDTGVDQAVKRIVFANEHRADAQLYFVDEQGAETLYGEIPAGETIEQQSYAGHRWRLKAGDVVLGDYVASDAPLARVPVRPGMGGDGGGRVAAASGPQAWQSVRTQRKFVLEADGTWSDRTPDGAALGYRVHELNGENLTLVSPNGEYTLLNNSGLYQTDGEVWQLIEEGRFTKRASNAAHANRQPNDGTVTNRVWQSDANPDNPDQITLREGAGGNWVMAYTGGQLQLRVVAQQGNNVTLTSKDGSQYIVTANSIEQPYSVDDSPDGESRTRTLATGQWQSATITPDGGPTAGPEMQAQRFQPGQIDLGAAGAAPTAGGATGSSVSPADAAAALKVHNDARQRVRVQPLQWSAELARDAQAYAERLAQADNGLNHDPSLGNDGDGENLSWVSGGNAGAEYGAKDWLEERPIWEQNGAGDTGHYTQMVWHGSKQVGIGVARSASGGVFIVGRYRPGGNMTGEPPYPGSKPIQ